MSSPIGPGKSPVSTASAAPPSSIRKSSTDGPASSGSSKLPKKKDATITISKPDMGEAVSSPGCSDPRPGFGGGDSATKLPSKAKSRPSNTAPIASTATGKASTGPKAPSNTAPLASTPTRKAQTAPKARLSNSAPIASTATIKAPTAPKAPPTLPQSPPSDAIDNSDTEDIESDSAAKKGNVEVSSPESASPTSSRSASPTPATSSSHPEHPSSGPKPQRTNTAKKRGHPKTSSDATPAKRIRSTPQSRAAPRASYNAASLVGEFTNFTTSIFIVQLGPESGPNCPKFHVHESVLVRSPILAHEIEVAKRAKTLTRQNILALFPHDPVAFEQMLQYLYKDTFILKSHTSSPLEARLNEIHELFSLAKHYVLPGLQRQVVKAFSQSRMVGKVPVNRFFDWSEDMYYEELDKEKGPFRAFFARVAPGLVKKAKEGEVGAIAKIVGQGGGFAGEIFKAMYAALEQETKKAVIKKEEGSLFEQKVFAKVPAAHDSEEGFVDAHSSSP